LQDNDKIIDDKIQGALRTVLEQAKSQGTRLTNLKKQVSTMESRLRTLEEKAQAAARSATASIAADETVDMKIQSLERKLQSELKRQAMIKQQSPEAKD